MFTKLPVLSTNLTTLCLSGVNLTDSNTTSITTMLKKMTQLQSFNISGNSGLTCTGLRKILVVLKTLEFLNDLDLARLNFDSNEDCFKEISAILLSCKPLKSLNLSRVQLDDSCGFYIIEAIAKAVSL